MPLTRRQAAALAVAPAALLFAPTGRAGEAAPWADDPRLAQLWRCAYPDCTPYYYDPVKGEPMLDVPPRTAFEDLPEDFWCPDCGSGKEVFVRAENRAEA